MASKVNAGIASIQSKFESGKKSIESNLEISKHEREIERLIEIKCARIYELGNLTHKALREGTQCIPDASLNIYNAVYAIDVQIKEIRDQIQKINISLNKEGIKCCGCGKFSPVSAKFCVHCGIPAKDDINSPKCSKCNGVLSVPDVYCPHCGTKRM